MVDTNPIAEIVIGWGEEHKLGVNEFSSNQEKQIDAVMDAAAPEDAQDC